MRCVRRHHAAIASTRAFRLSAARSPAPASRLVARDIDEMPVGHHPRVVGSVIAESRLSPLPSLDLRPIAQPRRPALASPGAFDAPSKTAPGDPRALSLSGDALAEDVAVAPSASASAGVDWERFAARQLSRHVPVAPDGLVLSDTPRGYRLRVHAVEEYPFGPEPHRVAGRGRSLEARCALSFYDEVTGSFHGATCSSLHEEMRIPVAGRVPEASENPDAAPVGTLDVQLDAYYTTRVRDARCLAVVEIVVVEREGDRVVRETSGGWAAIPTRGADGDEPSGNASVAPVRAGSPRYLMWGRPRAGQHPPSPLGRARRPSRSNRATPRSPSPPPYRTISR